MVGGERRQREREREREVTEKNGNANGFNANERPANVRNEHFECVQRKLERMAATDG